MLMQTDEANSLSHKSSIKVTGTLKLMHPGKAKQFQEDPDKGCMPNCLFNLWAFFFDWTDSYDLVSKLCSFQFEFRLLQPA